MASCDSCDSCSSGARRTVLGCRYPRLWAAGGLPEAAQQLVPVRTGGLLVLAKHLILYHTQVCSQVAMNSSVLCAWRARPRETPAGPVCTSGLLVLAKHHVLYCA